MDNCIYLFLICMLIISFYCLTVLDRISSNGLHTNGERKHPCSVASHRGKAFDFSWLSKIIAIGWVFLYAFFNKLKKFPVVMN